MSHPLVSIIMPAYNAEQFIEAAVRSVLAQTWPRWELIVVDDGSTDRTAAMLERFDDPRIQVLHRSNGGVSRARNQALDMARGEFVAFLDADDILPPASIMARLEMFSSHADVLFVDGRVLEMHNSTGKLSVRHAPTYQGPVFDRLMAMDAGVFFGPSWMIRRCVIGSLRFPERMAHAEDLAFFLKLARQGNYAATKEVVLHYRVGHTSAMKDLDGLHLGYLQLLELARELVPAPADRQLAGMGGRVRRIMVRSYLKKGRPWHALRTFLGLRPTGPTLI